MTANNINIFEYLNLTIDSLITEVRLDTFIILKNFCSLGHDEVNFLFQIDIIFEYEDSFFEVLHSFG